MIKILSDGMPHTRRELHACLPDDMGALSNIQFHLSEIRKRIRPEEDIVCEYYKRQLCYRRVRLIRSKA